jgi:hypothetical protein
VKDEIVDLLADSRILNRCKNNFFWVLNVIMFGDVWQMEICTAEPLLTDPSSFEVEIAVVKFRSYHWILIMFQQNLFNQGICKLINAIWNKK